jgi:YidC/Oxa1 family membrane protein insertase
MERRVLFAIFLCFLVLYFWQALVVKPVPKPAAGTTRTTTAGGPQASGAAAPSAGSQTGAPPTLEAPVPAAPGAAPVVGDTAERDIRVETRDVIAVFTNRGARLKSWKLKHYLDKQKQPQELVDSQLQPLPFTLRTPDESPNATLNGALYTVDGAPTEASSGTSGTSGSSSSTLPGPTNLRFEYRDSAGLHAIKEFHLDPSSYIVTLHATVVLGDRPLPVAVVWGPAVGDNLESSRLIQVAEGVLLENGTTTRLTPKDIATQATHEGNFRLAGVDDNYFMAAAMDPGPSRTTFQLVSVPQPAGSKPPTRELLSYTIEPRQNGAALKFFVGPKDLDVLTAIDREFASAINFGRFAVIVVPLLQSLKWVHSYVGNWGWSIVILTIIINLVMAPLRHKQVVSMRKMQEIQPEVKAIQDRYSKLKATDPAKQKMNQEMMALYREKKVNPAAGCIPMLLTLPIMMAMWAVLQVSIELRGAPWFGWIHDLSAPDPFYVLPIMMAGTQFLQQRMTPMAGADPAQQKMMMFMPLVMGFIFFSLPAGALLYYVAGTVIGIGQQYLTTRIIGPPIVRTPRPAAERRAKRVGGGKTDAASGN